MQTNEADIDKADQIGNWLDGTNKSDIIINNLTIVANDKNKNNDRDQWDSILDVYEENRNVEKILPKCSDANPPNPPKHPITKHVKPQIIKPLAKPKQKNNKKSIIYDDNDKDYNYNDHDDYDDY